MDVDAVSNVAVGVLLVLSLSLLVVVVVVVVVDVAVAVCSGRALQRRHLTKVGCSNLKIIVHWYFVT